MTVKITIKWKMLLLDGHEHIAPGLLELKDWSSSPLGHHLLPHHRPIRELCKLIPDPVTPLPHQAVIKALLKPFVDFQVKSHPSPSMALQ